MTEQCGTCSGAADLNGDPTCSECGRELPFAVGQEVFVQHEGRGRVVGWDEGSVYVTIESDGVTVAAAYEQVEL
jgi:hypothetical protein